MRSTHAISLVMFLAAALCGGCTGNAYLNVVALDYSTIDPQSPPPRTLEFDECYWWVDDDKELHIAMRKKVDIPFIGSLGKIRILAAIRPGGPPAGRERQYDVGPETFRICAEIGPAKTRFSSVRGVIAVAKDGDSRLRGNLRLESSRQVLQLFGDWGRPTITIWNGPFVAVRNREKTEEIEAVVVAEYAQEPEDEE